MMNKKKTYRYIKLFFSVLLASTIMLSCTKQEKEITKKPNIVLIVADDLGFGDIGCYGGDIKTPNIDKLSHRGIKFSSFHTAPMCAPTRAMLLSGNDEVIYRRKQYIKEYRRPQQFFS